MAFCATGDRNRPLADVQPICKQTPNVKVRGAVCFCGVPLDCRVRHYYLRNLDEPAIKGKTFIRFQIGTLETSIGVVITHTLIFRLYPYFNLFPGISMLERILLLESDTPIVRHIKIKAAANPHDPQWEPYFEARWVQKMLNSGRGRSKLYRVWLGQDCNCHDCHQPITKSTPWAFRHIVKRPDGGTDAASNLQMHHLNYHRRQHAEKEVV